MVIPEWNVNTKKLWIISKNSDSNYSKSTVSNRSNSDAGCFSVRQLGYNLL